MNLLQEEEVVKAIQDIHPDIIIHLAAQSSPQLSFSKPQLTFNINVIGTINLYEALRKLDLDPVIISVGSAAEYGKISPQAIPVTEQTELHPLDPYGASKVAMYYCDQFYHETYQMKIIHTRAFNHFGPFQPDTFAIASFCRQIAEIEQGKKPPLIQVGNLDAIRDYLDVRDVVRAYWILALNGKIGEIYNICSGVGHKMQEILDFLLKNAEVEIAIEMDPDRMRPADIPYLLGSNEKICRDMKWIPNFDFQESLIDTLNFWRRQVIERDLNQ